MITKISDKGITFIKSFEGVRLKAYRDVKGVLTIGIGHTKGVKAGQTCVNLGAKTQNYVDYLAIGIKGGKILSQSIAFRVETWPTQGSLLVGQVQSGNLSLRLSFLDDTEDSDQIAYDTSAGTLTFKSPVVKQG